MRERDPAAWLRAWARPGVGLASIVAMVSIVMASIVTLMALAGGVLGPAIASAAAFDLDEVPAARRHPASVAAQEPGGRLSPFIGTAEEPARVAREVLAQPEFRRPEPNLVQRAQAWVAEQLERILGRLSGGGRGAAVIGVVAVVGLLGLAASAVRFARGVTRDPGRSSRARPTPARTGAEWRAEAEAHERAGRWRMAVRCRYRALVAELAERGVVDEVAGRTAGEYRREIAAVLPAVAEPLGRATELFEAAWYGNRPTGEEDSADFRDLAHRVLAGRRL